MATPKLQRRKPPHIQAIEQVNDMAKQGVYGSPMESASIGRGGTTVYDEGKITLDGSKIKLSLEVRDGEAGFIRYSPTNRAGLLADPAFWGDEQIFVVAGPRRTESKAVSGYGGSNVYLSATQGELLAGIGSTNQSGVRVEDSGWVRASNANANLNMSPAGNVGLTGPGAGFTGNEDGGWSVGDTNLAVIQGSTQRALNMFGNAVNINATKTTVNGELAVTGAKNFLMDHPALEGHTIRYGSTESPVSAIECRGRVTIGKDGTATVEYPDHFSAIIKPGTDVDVSLSVYGPSVAWCDVPTYTGTVIHGTTGTVVGWKAYAERVGGDFTVVEAGTTEPPLPEPPAPVEETDQDPLVADMQETE